ncbi:MMPL family transporter [Ruminococcus sp. FC2018]|uniref:efflux RND transporter permease subunit n=1 Tax=Ruminococcus sp. FC2018 TaxID=1410617 RepID=UPI000490C1F1|nr:MMPL family transporter [Ruminococcus sp. FC2018]
MYKFGKAVVKGRFAILIISLVLLVPSLIGMLGTRINYDILSYLPKELDTMKGQDIMLDEFGKGGFAFVMIDGMQDKDVKDLEKKFAKVDHVCDVIWYDSIADINLPKEVLPKKLYDFFNSGDSTLLAVFFDSSSASDESLKALNEVKSIAGKQCFVAGMTAAISDIKDLTLNETMGYVILAVCLTSLVLALTMDSFLIPVFFMLSVGMAILYNLGSNFFIGEISFITQALTAVLQLGVTIDYSIFLWHSYKEEQGNHPGDNKEAMAQAISKTISSVVGSSITTVAGFLALCFMSYKLGLDMGIVMAKGVVIGVIACVTVLPSMILIFDKALTKTMHRDLIPKLDKLSSFIIRHRAVCLTAFLVVLIPAVYGYTHTDVYYDLTATLPKDLDSIVASTKLEEQYHMTSTHIIMCDADLEPKAMNNMLNEMNKVDGVKFSLGLNSLLGPNIPKEVIPEKLTEVLKSKNWQMVLVGSQYKTASDEVNKQIDKLQDIVSKYDSKAMVIGEAPCTKDLITVTDRDFKVVSAVSMVAIFLIIFFVLRSFSLPLILVTVIEFAIFVNMAIPCYTHTTIPFIASIVIGTIQLGATVDYAILMSTRYKLERNSGKDKTESVTIALSTSIKSIIVSALGFFAATFGVGVYSRVDMISQLCSLLSRGAIISMVTVILILPSMLMLFDPIIIRSTFGMKNARKNHAGVNGVQLPTVK